MCASSGKTVYLYLKMMTTVSFKPVSTFVTMPISVPFRVISRVRKTLNGSSGDIGWLQDTPGFPPVEDGTARFRELLENIRCVSSLGFQGQFFVQLTSKTYMISLFTFLTLLNSYTWNGYVCCHQERRTRPTKLVRLPSDSRYITLSCSTVSINFFYIAFR